MVFANDPNARQAPPFMAGKDSADCGARRCRVPGESIALEDIRDPRFDYPRTTPEKALLDWIYLGASPRSRMTRPPYDLDTGLLNGRRLRRLARKMGLSTHLEALTDERSKYLEDEDVQENGATRLRF